MVYHIEYAKSGRSNCKGPKNDCPKEDRVIEKGQLRLGSEVPNIHGLIWRHWTCTTPKVLENIKNDYSDVTEIEGFNELREDDQERVRNAWELGEIPENEKPEPAAEHIDPKAKRRGSASLPATNEEASSSQKSSQPKSNRKGKRKAKVEEESEDVKEENDAKREHNTEEENENEEGETTNNDDDAKEEGTSKTIKKKAPAKRSKKAEDAVKEESESSKKTEDVASEPKVAKYARTKKEVASPRKSKGEPTRRSARVAGQKADTSVTVVESSRRKRKSPAPVSATKKSKKD